MADPVTGPPAGKIFPRNLTARADHVVRGNPAASRPESGVDNCYPGLEFDQRNLDKAFFPGLTFEFHRPDGAVLRRVDATGIAAERGLTDADLPLHLWAVCGRTTVDQTEADIPTFSCANLGGLDVWRVVHDLMPGRIAILLGPAPGISSSGADAVNGSLNGFRRGERSVVQRDPDGTVLAVLVADRARYLDPEGVIDPEIYLPGELTRSLCAPWQYDFRDCGCFYWAASKPDVVTSADGQVPYVNFQRGDRTAVPPPADLPTEAGRREQELDYAEMLHAWNDLSVVLGGRETAGVAPPPPPGPTAGELTRKKVLTELNYLATVEHALSVEYLFAHYSLDVPRLLPDDAGGHTRRVHAAATEVYSIAVDEMRHLRWVNEALALLGQPPNVGRARRIHRQLNRPFQLRPLTPAQLDWFIEVERPSQGTASGVDGMYVRLLTTIDTRPDLFPERDRLVHLIKLIIDEGGEHFRRFGLVKGHLAGLAPESYLRTLQADPVDALTGGLADLSDQNYALLLNALQATFALGDRAGGQLLEQARRSMFSLHETNHLLAARGVQPRFALPVPVTLPVPIADHAAGIRRAQETVAELGGAPERRLVLQHGAAHEALLAELQAAGTGTNAAGGTVPPPAQPPPPRTRG